MDCACVGGHNLAIQEVLVRRADDQVLESAAIEVPRRKPGTEKIAPFGLAPDRLAAPPANTIASSRDGHSQSTQASNFDSTPLGSCGHEATANSWSAVQSAWTSALQL